MSSLPAGRSHQSVGRTVKRRMDTRRGRRQLQFTGAEMTALAISFVLTSTFVFLLGFYVGKKNAAEHVPRDERVARIPVDDFSKYARPAAGAAQTAPAEGDDATLPHKAAARAKTEAGGADGAAEPKSDAAVASAPQAGESRAKVAQDGAASATAPARAGAADKAEAAGGARASEEAAKAAADSAAAQKAETRAAAAKAAEAKAAEARAAEKTPDEEDRKTSGGGYTVQVLATRKQADAEALVKKLSARGYGAYIKRVSDGHASWYRVRVGSYGGFGEARTMADHCRRDLGLEQAFVSTQ